MWCTRYTWLCTGCLLNSEYNQDHWSRILHVLQTFILSCKWDLRWNVFSFKWSFLWFHYESSIAGPEILWMFVFFPHKGKRNRKRWKSCVFDGRWSCTAWRKPFEVSPVVFLAVLQWLSQLVLQVTQWTLGWAKFWEDKNAALLWMCYYLSTPFMFSGTRPSMTARFDSKICNTKKNKHLKQSANNTLP